jgi:hypothetical protein
MLDISQIACEAQYIGTVPYMLCVAKRYVADPDPSDPYVFGPPGFGSSYHQAKILK